VNPRRVPGPARPKLQVVPAAETVFGFSSYAAYLASMRLVLPRITASTPPLWPLNDEEAAAMGCEISQDDRDR
jgi:hypothetical protein